jgi:hypothetical protein
MHRLCALITQGRVWANKTLEREISPPSVCGFETPTTILRMVLTNSKIHTGKQMDNVYTLTQSLDRLDIIDAIDERLAQIKSILTCLSVTEDGSFELCNDGSVYGLLSVVIRLIDELKELHDLKV